MQERERLDLDRELMRCIALLRNAFLFYSLDNLR